jgi:protoporphyrinogen oxidase
MNLVDNLCGAFFAVSARELPAEIFPQCVTSGDAFTNIGYPAGGAAEVWKALARYIEARGGAVWLGSPARRLVFGADGLGAGAEVLRNGEPVQVSAGW